MKIIKNFFIKKIIGIILLFHSFNNYIIYLLFNLVKSMFYKINLKFFLFIKKTFILSLILILFLT
jgi:hypothetical protein